MVARRLKATFRLGGIVYDCDGSCLAGAIAVVPSQSGLVATRRSRQLPKDQSISRTLGQRRRPRLVHQFLIVLTGTDPLVWRRIQVPERYSFWDLHVAIQDRAGALG